MGPLANRPVFIDPKNRPTHKFLEYNMSSPVSDAGQVLAPVRFTLKVWGSKEVSQPLLLALSNIDTFFETFYVPYSRLTKLQAAPRFKVGMMRCDNL